jgi:ABC-type Fe3+ transport system substrate-binding protein
VLARPACLGIIAALLLLAGACAQPARAPAPAAPSGAPAAAAGASGASSEWDRLVEAAKQEGEVIVWGSAGSAARRHEKEAFEQAYPGIKVTLFQAPSNSERDSRFLQEYQAGVAKVDVLVSGGAGINGRMKPASMVQDARPFLILPEVTNLANWRDGRLDWVDEEKRYIPQADMDIQTNLAVNESVNPAELQNWEDLLNPKWRGKIVMLDPRKSGNGLAIGLFMYYTPELGPEFVQRLFSEMDVTFSPDERQNVEWVISGRMLIALRPANQELSQAQAVGAKLTVIPALRAKGKAVSALGGSPGIFAIPNLEPLPHPNATKVYVNWLYSRAGQQAMVDHELRASRRLDVDHGKLPAYAQPQPDVEYLNLLHYTGTDVVQRMRDDVSRWAPN